MLIVTDRKKEFSSHLYHLMIYIALAIKRPFVPFPIQTHYEINILWLSDIKTRRVKESENYFNAIVTFSNWLAFN